MEHIQMIAYTQSKSQNSTIEDLFNKYYKVTGHDTVDIKFMEELVKMGSNNL